MDITACFLPFFLSYGKSVQSVDGGQPGSGGAAGGCSKPIMPVSPNKSALDPSEEELFADSESKVRLPGGLCQEQSPDLMVRVLNFLTNLNHSLHLDSPLCLKPWLSLPASFCCDYL